MKSKRKAEIEDDVRPACAFKINLFYLLSCSYPSVHLERSIFGDDICHIWIKIVDSP